MKILVCDPISPKGIALLQQRPELQVTVLPKRLSEAELLPLVSDVVAMLVRSETKVTRKVIEGAPQLRVVGRAGVGVDNVDVEAASIILRVTLVSERTTMATTSVTIGSSSASESRFSSTVT